MPINKGVSKKIAIKKETTWGNLAGAAGAKYLRRVSAMFNQNKETYTSEEIRTDYQTADMRHGIISIEGSVNGELSPGSYSDLMSAVVARDFTAVTSLTGLSLTIAASGITNTITRAAGSWLTDNIKVGHIIQLTGVGLNTANQANNILVVSVTALVITGVCLSNTPLVVEGPIASVGVTVRGKTTYAPLANHTDDSFTVEEWYSDIAQSEVYTGNKVGSMNIQLPTTGLVTVDFSLMGKDLTQVGTTQYFTSPTAEGTSGTFSSVAGVVMVNGAAVGLITQMDIGVERGLEAANVIFSNTAADVFTGRIGVTGNFTTYFQDAIFREYFRNESEVSIVFALTTGKGKSDHAISITMPRVKVGSASKDGDTEMGTTRSCSFTALLGDGTLGREATTIQIVDTSI